MKIFNIGNQRSHQSRHREARINKLCAIPCLRLLYKDHKLWNPSDGPPLTRPVCGGNSGMNVHLSELVSLILEPLASNIPGSWEVISQEDLLSKGEDHNDDV